MNTYKYAVSGTGDGAKAWQIDGHVEAEPGNLPSVFDQAMRETFGALTSHKAVFGQPGVGCSGPYRITRLLIEMVHLTVGARVRLVNDISNYPHFEKIAAGATGTVIAVMTDRPDQSGWPYAHVKLDQHVPELDEWGNVLHVWRDNPEFPNLADFEPIEA